MDFVLYIFLVGRYTNAVSLPPVDVILANLACPINDIISVEIRTVMGLRYMSTVVIVSVAWQAQVFLTYTLV
jgi:hypothetical protein